MNSNMLNASSKIKNGPINNMFAILPEDITNIESNELLIIRETILNYFREVSKSRKLGNFLHNYHKISQELQRRKKPVSFIDNNLNQKINSNKFLNRFKSFDKSTDADAPSIISYLGRKHSAPDFTDIDIPGFLNDKTAKLKEVLDTKHLSKNINGLTNLKQHMASQHSIICLQTGREYLIEKLNMNFFNNTDDCLSKLGNSKSNTNLILSEFPQIDLKIFNPNNSVIDRMANKIDEYIVDSNSNLDYNNDYLGFFKF